MTRKEQVLNWVDYMLKSNPCMNVEDRNMFNAIKYYITEKQTDGDLISRQAVIDMLNKLIEVEQKQGTDVMNYGRERVNAYESILDEIESDYLFPSMPSAEKTTINPEKTTITDGDLITEIDKLPRIKVGNSNSPTVKYCIDEVLLYDLLEHYKEREEK